MPIRGCGVVIYKYYVYRTKNIYKSVTVYCMSAVGTSAIPSG